MPYAVVAELFQKQFRSKVNISRKLNNDTPSVTQSGGHSSIVSIVAAKNTNIKRVSHQSAVIYKMSR
jgi:hypothetical protein